MLLVLKLVDYWAGSWVVESEYLKAELKAAQMVANWVEYWVGQRERREAGLWAV